MNKEPTTHYSPLRDSDSSSSHSLLAEEEGKTFDYSQPPSSRQTKNTWYHRGKIVIIGIWTSASILMFFQGLRWQTNTNFQCLTRDTYYSPIWDEVDPSFTTLRFNGSLNAPSDFRGPPSAAVDAAWTTLDGIESVSFDEETFLKAGGTKENAKMPDDLGGGYMADIEVLHQMHCLNFVRMAAYSDHYSSIAPEWKDSEKTFHIHLDHCIEMIRQNLLCRTDAGIIPFRWVENYQRPLPDFSTMHKCRNWEGVIDWARKREVNVPPGYEWKHQPSEKVFPRPEWMPKPQ